MNETTPGVDPWSPVDESSTSVDNVEPTPPLEIRGGNVTAHIDLGGDTKPAEEEPAEEPAAEEEAGTEEEKTAAEVEEAEATLAEKLAALDAAKTTTPKKTKK